MTRRWIALCLLIAGWVAVSVEGAHAQGLSLDVSAGRLVYDPVSVNLGTNNVMGTLRYDARRGGWVYGTGAAPLREGDPIWGASGGGGRFTQLDAESRRLSFGVDADAHGFVFRDRIALLTGTGGAAQAIPFASLGSGSGHIELRGGWRGQTLSFASETIRRGVIETGARAIYGQQVRAQGDVKWVHATEGTFPFVGGTVSYGGARVQVWGQTGKWLSDQLDEVAWGGGVGVPIGVQSTLWATLRQEAPDPLYWNAVRRTWSIGFTRRLGRGVPLVQPAPRTEGGDVVVRVSVADAPGDQLFIAGDFNKWVPVPMQREGLEWTIRLALPKGVYNYAFRSARGDWFVPASTSGRRDDGFGGQVAVMVVM